MSEMFAFLLLHLNITNLIVSVFIVSLLEYRK